MKRLIAVLGLFLFLAGAVNAAPKDLKKHALAKVVMAPITIARYTPRAVEVTGKVAGKGIAYTFGSVLFVTESGIDVVHLATDVLDKGVAAEGWKRNVFHYPNKIVGYADTGTETAYNFLFHIQI